MLASECHSASVGLQSGDLDADVAGTKVNSQTGLKVDPKTGAVVKSDTGVDAGPVSARVSPSSIVSSSSTSVKTGVNADAAGAKVNSQTGVNLSRGANIGASSNTDIDF